jgi:hypothetical protein
VIEVEMRREPLTSFALVTATRNFNRHAAVSVEQPDGARTKWRTIGEGTISRIDFRKLSREQLRASFPETREAKYRITIDNRDSPPLEVTGVEAEGNAYELAFLAAPAEKYRLAYGADRAAAPRYDTAAIESLLKEGYAPSAVLLGPPSESTAAAQRPPFEWSRLLNDSRLLIAVIAVLVVVLGFALYRAGRTLDKLPPE